MNGLDCYEKAVTDHFYSGMDFKSLPLLSWDVYAEHFSDLVALGRDLASLEIMSAGWQQSWNFKKALMERDEVVLVTNMKQEIVFCSSNIYKLNGYAPEEVLGGYPGMFQGPGTCKEETMKVRQAVQEKRPFDTRLLNYRKDGSVYDCIIQGRPAFDRRGECTHFVAFEWVA